MEDGIPFQFIFCIMQFVRLGSSSTRMKKFADFIHERLTKEGLDNGSVLSLSKTDRYVMYKAGPVLLVNVSV